ncbi:hypothetical protein VTJ49DRAFT_3581 [Mycothermus thermophilus]|uniref:GH18 domain-containing protein n=1 Tax=Humicola insolens TaxID=85995 RepID=A0ABR3V797_HUMIN
MTSIKVVWSFFFTLFISISIAADTAARHDLRCLMYYTRYARAPRPRIADNKSDQRLTRMHHSQHPEAPPLDQLERVNHVAVASMSSESLNKNDWTLFTTIDDVRSKFANGTKILVAIGGWGDHKGFETAAWNDRTRKRFSRNVAKMVEKTGADGVDLDWEYPG